MAFKMLGGGSDVNTVVSDMNSNILEMINQDKAKFFKDDTGTRVVMIDQNGLKTTAPGSGIDVTTATDVELTFNSNTGVRYITSFTTSFSLTSGVNFTAVLVTITHGLGYIPITDNLANITTNDWSGSETGIFPLPYQSMATSGGIRGYAAYVILKRVTTTTITYEVGITGGTLTLAGTITCYIKQTT